MIIHPVSWSDNAANFDILCFYHFRLRDEASIGVSSAASRPAHTPLQAVTTSIDISEFTKNTTEGIFLVSTKNRHEGQVLTAGN